MKTIFARDTPIGISKLRNVAQWFPENLKILAIFKNSQSPSCFEKFPPVGASENQCKISFRIIKVWTNFRLFLTFKTSLRNDWAKFRKTFRLNRNNSLNFRPTRGYFWIICAFFQGENCFPRNSRSSIFRSHFVCFGVINFVCSCGISGYVSRWTIDSRTMARVSYRSVRRVT